LGVAAWRRIPAWAHRPSRGWKEGPPGAARRRIPARPEEAGPAGGVALAQPGARCRPSLDRGSRSPAGGRAPPAQPGWGRKAQPGKALPWPSRGRSHVAQPERGVPACPGRGCCPGPAFIIPAWTLECRPVALYAGQGSYIPARETIFRPKVAG
jgi:hypothetical protein